MGIRWAQSWRRCRRATTSNCAISARGTGMNILESRRYFLARSGVGLAALATLMKAGGHSEDRRDQLAGSLFVPKAKRVIYLFQSGAPSQMDLFDHKPRLRALRGSELPDSVRRGQRLTGMTSRQESFPVAP